MPVNRFGKAPFDVEHIPERVSRFLPYIVCVGVCLYELERPPTMSCILADVY